MKATFVIVGGGIAGVTCAESISFLAPEETVILITASSLIKAITNIVPLGKTLFQFDVEERESSQLSQQHSSITILQDIVCEVNSREKFLKTESGKIVNYQKLCLCTGASPRIIAENNPYVLGIRDTESVTNFLEKIKNARRIVIVGNGGIATELVYKIRGIEVIWVIKDKHISATFVDPGAAQFFQDRLQNKVDNLPTQSDEVKNFCFKRARYTTSEEKTKKVGAALGPDWHNFKLTQFPPLPIEIQVKYECEVLRITNRVNEEWPVVVELTNGETVNCDLVISATGVIPNANLPGLEDLKRGQDGGYLVDWKLTTSQDDIFAAGDVCSANWDIARHWFQMRLWTQAHQMGQYAAKAMVSITRDEEFYQDFCFEIFTHVTKFFDYKVVLLGLYNGQTLNQDYEILLRMTKNQEYVKLILKDGKMQGAVLIGETDLEEMCENLILNQLDLSVYGEDLLNPDIDIEDYFD
ncbi:pyridine nucleotide-disulfide oxidoreductase domain-containing protein 1 [Leptopilina heterotoma]|uniref:pyridine nucleotide-disulfide oxidoreductase domain-containing protein 1 n=1 Tax=Leptopilina heterotoma TaxID=63436 RepID=UPI001CA8C4BC|nr:pyridine nucleotide-disulfide oxidoreductase domain-containing protein 1 [Leptopilina heterotoma]